MEIYVTKDPCRNFHRDNQLENYENILQKIEQEHKNLQELNERIEKAKNNLLFLKFSKLKNNIQENLSHVELLVFVTLQEIIELFNLDLSHINDINTCNLFLLITVFITKPVFDLCSSQNWYINTQVKDEYNCISTSISIKDSNILRIVVPISVGDYTVETFLCSSIDNNPVILPLNKVPLDISYFFGSLHTRQGIDSKILKISSLYSRLKYYDPDQYMIESNFYNPKGKDFIINSLLKNCYVKISPSDAAATLDENKTLVIKCDMGPFKSRIIYNDETKMIKVRSNVNDLILLKRYLAKELEVDENVETLKLMEFVDAFGNFDIEDA